MGNVLDHGFVVLEDMMGGDLSVVNAARVSFAQKSTRLDDSEVGLIKYLMKNHHGTPFEHAVFTWRVKAPIFVTREWMRHRIGSFNEWSGRYSELTTEFYFPAVEAVRKQVGKPGAYTYEAVSVGEAVHTRQQLKDTYDHCAYTYKHLLARGIAKELASRVLPTAVYTQFVWTVNARALMNFLALRNSEHAQFEIRQYAKEMEAEFDLYMPHTAGAFAEAGRVAP